MEFQIKNTRPIVTLSLKQFIVPSLIYYQISVLNSYCNKTSNDYLNGVFKGRDVINFLEFGRFPTSVLFRDDLLVLQCFL